MKAVYLEGPGESLKIVDQPEPRLQSGGAIVKILAAPVLSFMKKVISGELKYAMATPWIPGANGVGIVESIADDVIGLNPGDRVFIDPHVYTHTTTGAYDGILIGLTALSPSSSALQKQWRNGTFAEKALIPAECLTRLPTSTSVDIVQLSTLSVAAIAYGGLLKGDLRPGQTLVVSGATGNIGCCAVLVGLAMGAKRIVALGREERILDELKALDPLRVVPVRLKGEFGRDTREIIAAAEGADLVYDILGNVSSFGPTSAAINSLKHGGTAILMGGVQARVDLLYSHIMLNEITIKGAFMYRRSAPGELVNLVLAGTLELSKLHVRQFPLEEVNGALNFAESNRGPVCTVLVP